MTWIRWSLMAGLAFGLTVTAATEPDMKALIIDGQSNHKNWEESTQLLKGYLEETGLFMVDVATSPPDGEDLGGYRPIFADYDVVVSNYSGNPWSRQTQQDFEQYVGGGGGFVVVHSANNAFPEWKAYNEIIGVGGWGNRDERWGPYLRYRDGEVVRDASPGRGGAHGEQHEFIVKTRDDEHPITAGLPAKWLHANDELYDRLRGPAKDLEVLATAYSDPATDGTGEHEPMVMTIQWGEGRIFHTPMGHGLDSQSCLGFITVFQRGTEWAAAGEVTRKQLPKNFPGADQVSMRKLPKGMAQ